MEPIAIQCQVCYKPLGLFLQNLTLPKVLIMTSWKSVFPIPPSPYMCYIMLSPGCSIDDGTAKTWRLDNLYQKSPNTMALLGTLYLTPGSSEMGVPVNKPSVHTTKNLLRLHCVTHWEQMR